MEESSGPTATNRRLGIQTKENDVQVQLLPEEPEGSWADAADVSSSSGEDHLDSDSVEEEAAEEAAAIPVGDQVQNLIVVISGGISGAGAGIGIGYAASHTEAGMGAGVCIGMAGGVVVSAMALKAIRVCTSNHCNIL